MNNATDFLLLNVSVGLGASLNLNVNTRVKDLTLSGHLEGPGHLNVTETMVVCSTASFTGPGRIRVQRGSKIILFDGVSVSGRDIELVDPSSFLEATNGTLEQVEVFGEGAIKVPLSGSLKINGSTIMTHLFVDGSLEVLSSIGSGLMSLITSPESSFFLSSQDGGIDLRFATFNLKGAVFLDCAEVGKDIRFLDGPLNATSLKLTGNDSCQIFGDLVHLTNGSQVTSTGGKFVFPDLFEATNSSIINNGGAMSFSSSITFSRSIFNQQAGSLDIKSSEVVFQEESVLNWRGGALKGNSTSKMLFNNSKILASSSSSAWLTAAAELRGESTFFVNGSLVMDGPLLFSDSSKLIIDQGKLSIRDNVVLTGNTSFQVMFNSTFELGPINASVLAKSGARIEVYESSILLDQGNLTLEAGATMELSGISKASRLDINSTGVITVKAGAQVRIIWPCEITISGPLWVVENGSIISSVSRCMGDQPKPISLNTRQCSPKVNTTGNCRMAYNRAIIRNYTDQAVFVVPPNSTLSWETPITFERNTTGFSNYVQQNKSEMLLNQKFLFEEKSGAIVTSQSLLQIAGNGFLQVTQESTLTVNSSRLIVASRFNLQSNFSSNESNFTLSGTFTVVNSGLATLTRSSFIMEPTGTLNVKSPTKRIHNELYQCFSSNRTEFFDYFI